MILYDLINLKLNINSSQFLFSLIKVFYITLSAQRVYPENTVTIASCILAESYVAGDHTLDSTNLKNNSQSWLQSFLAIPVSTLSAMCMSNCLNLSIKDLSALFLL